MLAKITDKLIFPKSGRYIVAVSGGVDSVSLLDILVSRPSYQLVVAHYDHAVRADSKKDVELVKALASNYGLEFVSQKAPKNRKFTEANAREQRYKFLSEAQKKHKCASVITAHHLDDALETAIFNNGRGADVFGLTPMHLSAWPLRPLLDIRKKEVLAYAKVHKLKWREDTTNAKLDATRNLIRHLIIPKLSQRSIEDFRNLAKNNRAGFMNVNAWLDKTAEHTPKTYKLKRLSLIMSDDKFGRQVLRMMVNNLGGAVENKTVAGLLNFCKTAENGKQFLVSDKLRAHITDDMITLVTSR